MIDKFGSILGREIRQDTDHDSSMCQDGEETNCPIGRVRSVQRDAIACAYAQLPIQQTETSHLLGCLTERIGCRMTEISKSRTIPVSGNGLVEIRKKVSIRCTHVQIFSKRLQRYKLFVKYANKSH